MESMLIVNPVAATDSRDILRLVAALQLLNPGLPGVAGNADYGALGIPITDSARCSALNPENQDWESTCVATIR
jgi:hypothetical protein